MLSARKGERVRQEEKLKVKDLCPSILAITGANINFNNEGMISR
jgi:hypothetical protein